MKDEEGTMLGQQADVGVSPREGGRLPMRGDAGGEGRAIKCRATNPTNILIIIEATAKLEKELV